MAAPPAHWLPAFLKFCSVITINSKNHGRVPLRVNGAQRRFLTELHGALEKDIHHAVCLKSRQLGMSTILLALDLFYLFMFPGLQGALIYDTAKNTQQARLLLTDMLSSLPDEWAIPVELHNRDALVLANGSSLQYMSAGKGKNSGLGRSRALNFVHASESSSWGDQDGIDSLKAAMSDNHPDRLYIFESTALGYNVFFDLWQEAKNDPSKVAIFLGWWTLDDYTISRDDPLFAHYWLADPELSEEEAETQHAVAEQYGHDITPEQWAWYRYKTGGELTPSLLQEYPSTEIQAFQSSGHAYFPNQRINADLAFLYQAGPKAGFLGFKYTFGRVFNQLKCEAVDNVDEVDLRIWEQPRVGGRYVIGMDVAYGRDEENDRTVISIWRCYSDKLVQVAEYATPEPTEREATWVLAHLAGCYQDSIINVEVNGPGGAVMNEMRNLKDSIHAGQFKDVGPTFDPKWTLDQARWFLYTRVDSIGSNYMYNTQTTASIKERYCSGFRDGYKFEEILIRSIPMLHEMTTFIRTGDRLEASGRNKDDRIMAACFAWASWFDHIRPGQRALGHDYATITRAEQQVASGALNVTDWIWRESQREWAEDRAAAADNQRRLLEI